MRTVICVLHYNRNDLTDKCIALIREHTLEKGDYHILLIDNHSDIPYQAEGKDITVIRNDNNGAVSGMNLGFYTALYKMPFTPDYIVNIDNDVFVMPNWLPPLVKLMDNHPKIGIASGKQWLEDKSAYGSVGMDLMGILYKNYPTKSMNVIWIQGSFVIMRAEMMRRIGLHDSRYHTICSDSDYCLHAIDRGWQVIFTPDSEVVHIGGASFGKKETEHGPQDQAKFIQKWCGLKFNKLLELMPMSIKNKEYGKVSLFVNGKECIMGAQNA